MKHSIVVLLMTAIAIASCNNRPVQSALATNTKDTSKVIENKIMIPASTCYSSTIGKDSFFLKVEVFPNVVTGRLLYKFHEKDNNTGDLDGHLYGDTLLADYTHMSEGIRSTRQVVFLIQDSVAIEGYGNLEEKNGKMVFKNRKEIAFQKGLILKKIPCGEY